MKALARVLAQVLWPILVGLQGGSAAVGRGKGAGSQGRGGRSCRRRPGGLPGRPAAAGAGAAGRGCRGSGSRRHRPQTGPALVVLLLLGSLLTRCKLCLLSQRRLLQAGFRSLIVSHIASVKACCCRQHVRGGGGRTRWLRPSCSSWTPRLLPSSLRRRQLFRWDASALGIVHIRLPLPSINVRSVLQLLYEYSFSQALPEMSVAILQPQVEVEAAIAEAETLAAQHGFSEADAADILADVAAAQAAPAAQSDPPAASASEPASDQTAGGTAPDVSAAAPAADASEQPASAAPEATAAAEQSDAESASAGAGGDAAEGQAAVETEAEHVPCTEPHASEEGPFANNESAAATGTEATVPDEAAAEQPSPAGEPADSAAICDNGDGTGGAAVAAVKPSAEADTEVQD